jgi:acyl-[acyl carrier protein]--UDP-N-acetylglucosamine O-acyltransferase
MIPLPSEMIPLQVGGAKNDKFKLVKEFIRDPKTKHPQFYRLVANRDINPVGGKPVKKGDLGGLIRQGGNLSPYGECWVYKNAIVNDECCVEENAIIEGKASLVGYVNVRGYAQVGGYAHLFGGIRVAGQAKINGNAEVSGVVLKHYPGDFEYSIHIEDSTVITGKARIEGRVDVYGCARIDGNAFVQGGTVRGYAVVTGSAVVPPNAQLEGNVMVSLDYDVIVIKNNFARDRRWVTYVVSQDHWQIGCWGGKTFDLKERLKTVSIVGESSDMTKRRQEGYKYMMKYVSEIRKMLLNGNN